MSLSSAFCCFVSRPSLRCDGAMSVRRVHSECRLGKCSTQPSCGSEAASASALSPSVPYSDFAYTTQDRRDGGHTGEGLIAVNSQRGRIQ